ncbi:MAG: DNA-binding protein [Fuerstiella sp.]|nr:DNA-binding protein [Fuerstiella sp.]
MPPDCCVADFSSLVVVANIDIARDLNEIADLLQAQRANSFRVQAYRAGADTLAGLRLSAQEILEDEGRLGLIELPGIGKSLAAVVEERIQTGHSSVLDRLRGDAQAERMFATVPGIGPELASRIHGQLGIDTLQELEQAAHSGSLMGVSGMGRRRVLAVRESLAGRFQRGQREFESLFDNGSQDISGADDVSVADLLWVDEQYRRRAAAEQLVRIAPRRFNPNGKAWLPILHTERSDQHFTALYSNSARAHQLGKTRDWVIIHHDDAGNGQWTVVTEHRGRLKGRRAVRGREIECSRCYTKKELLVER